VSILKRIGSRPYEGELGFGKTPTAGGRFLNPDGSFNVVRENAGFWDNTYFHLMTMPWWQFTGMIVVGFGLLNTLFALLYCLVGIENLNGIEPGGFVQNFTNAYFFSSQTLTTVGYGHISPGSFGANLVASFESFAGLLAFALISGLLYGRFSRPEAKIVFSENMLVSPYKNGKALMLRMSNAQRSEMIETESVIFVSLNQRSEAGQLERRFYPLPLEISKISFFSLSWTLVHPLDENSPLHGFSLEELKEAQTEIMVLVKGIEEANQQMVHARRSYTADEIVSGAKFLPVISRNGRGKAYVITSKIGDYERIETADAVL
jgi:inward rectifier potassium channel